MAHYGATLIRGRANGAIKDMPGIGNQPARYGDDDLIAQKSGSSAQFVGEFG
jgi:hypothetical protein